MICVSPTPTDASMGAYAALGFVVASSVYENAITPRPLAVTPIAGYVREAPAMPYVPCMTILLLVGLRMYHAIPARSGLESTKLTAVSSAPQSLPFAYITCCMRVSFESGLAITSVPAACAAGPTSSFQHPIWPSKSSVVVSFKQSPCATSGVVALSAVVPDPGCTCFGGTPYWFTVVRLLLKLRAGVVLSEDVFVSVQATICVEVRVPAAPETGFCASSAAFELRKYSVPPFARLNCEVPGDCAGQTVNPGCVEPASLGTLTAPNVSM